MTRIYVDVDAAAIMGAAIGPSLDPAAPRALALLGESGHEVVLVAPDGREPPAGLAAVATDVVAAPPARTAAAAWYLTADVERCQGSPAHLRTVLVGAAPAPGSVHRCDAAARDIHAAVLEILASEAMPPGR